MASLESDLNETLFYQDQLQHYLEMANQLVQLVVAATTQPSFQSLAMFTFVDHIYMANWECQVMEF